MVLDKAHAANPKLDCQAIADVEMEVPAGATVQVQTRDGDITIAGVAALMRVLKTATSRLNALRNSSKRAVSAAVFS